MKAWIKRVALLLALAGAGVAVAQVVTTGGSSSSLTGKFRQLWMYGETAGVAGDVTINKAAGTFIIDAAASTATVTNSLLGSGTWLIFCQPHSMDATLTSVSCQAGVGSFLATGNNNASGTVTVSFLAVRQL